MEMEFNHLPVNTSETDKRCCNGSLTGIATDSEEFFSMLELFLTTPVHILSSTAGVVTNLLNMLVMSRIGLKTSMNIGIFMLSVTDFFTTLLELAITLCLLISKVLPYRTSVDIFGLGQVIFSWIRYPGFFISSWITTIMSIEKCLAVVTPLIIKQIFTKKVSIYLITFLYLTFVSVIFPVFRFEFMEWETGEITVSNGSVEENRFFTVVFTEGALVYESVIDITFAMAMSVTSHSILIICTITTILYLKKSSRIRQKKVAPHMKSMAGRRRNKYAANSTCLTSKEKRMVKVVLCMSLALIACNVPRYVNIVLTNAFLDVLSNVNKKLLWFLWGLNDFVISVNCSSHFIVYWLLNEKFRNCCRLMFRTKCFLFSKTQRHNIYGGSIRIIV